MPVPGTGLSSTFNPGLEMRGIPISLDFDFSSGGFNFAQVVWRKFELNRPGFLGADAAWWCRNWHSMVFAPAATRGRFGVVSPPYNLAQCGQKAYACDIECMSKPYPLVLPTKLKEEVRRAAVEAIRFGLPILRKHLSIETDHAEAAADTWEKLGPAPTIHYDKL